MYSVKDDSLESGFPIRTSPDYRLLPAPRSFSQAITSFIACNRQGIHHMHLFAWPYNQYVLLVTGIACLAFAASFQLHFIRITLMTLAHNFLLYLCTTVLLYETIFSFYDWTETEISSLYKRTFNTIVAIIYPKWLLSSSNTFYCFQIFKELAVIA